MKAVPAIVLAAGMLSAQQPDGAAFNPPWTSQQTMHAADLAKMVGKNQPHVFQVGFAQLYRSKHVPGSIYAGPALNPEGLAELKKAVASLPKDAPIVLYCGCCPWDHCPNMKPAFKLLHGLGYSNVKIVEIPDNFGQDWVEKGYPVEGNSAHSN